MKTNFTRRISRISRAFLFAFGLVGLSLASNAQTLLTENFDATTIGGTSCTSVCAGPTGWTNTAAATNGTWWGAHSGGTSSSSTGPTGDHTSGTGRYMYTETSGCYGKAAFLVTPSMNFTSYTGMVLEFWYHMYGAAMGTMYVDVSTDNGTTWSTTPAWTMSGDQGNLWKLASVNLAAYTGTGMGTVKVRFRSFTGTSFTSDMSIDDVTIYAPAAQAYVSSTTTQANTQPVAPGDANQVIIGVEVVTTGLLTPFNVTQLNFNTTGTTAIADISNAKVYYTGTSPNFATTNQFGTTLAVPTATFNVAGTQSLNQGTNYFWLTYDIASTALPSHVVDAQCTQLTISGTVGNKTPTVTSPAGSRTIMLQKVIGTGTLNNYLPINNYYGYTYSQSIYTPAQIGATKVIDTLYYYFQGPGWSTGDNVQLYMGHTSKTAFTSTSDWIAVSSLTQVYNATAMAPSNNQGWYKFVLSTPFMYNGVDNLVIAADENTPGYHSSSDFFHTSSASAGTSLRYYSDGTNPNPVSPPAGTLLGFFPNIKIQFTNPAPMAYDTIIVEQNNTALAVKGQENDIISVNVKTTGGLTPFNVTNLYFNTTGTTTLGDIDSAKVYYTGSSNTFAPTNHFGTITTIGANLVFTGSQTIANGSNYFWLTYYVDGIAVDGNFIDAGCDSVVVNSIVRTPVISNPTGNRKIAGPYNGVYTLGNDSTDDFSSFANASFMLDLLGVSGQVTILVDSGTYNEQVTIESIPGASATNTITFKGSGNSTIFYESTNSGERAVVTFDGAKHVILDSLNIISGPAATYGWGIHLWHASDSNTVKNCLIKLNNVGNSSNFNAIVATNSKTSYSTNGNNANYLTLDNNVISGGYYGVCLRGLNNTTGLASGNKIINNTVKDYTYYGLYIYYQDAPEISGNEITGISTAYYHIYLYYCDNDMKVTNNTIDFQYGYGMYAYYCDGTTSARGLIANNMISQHTRNSTAYGMRINYSANMDIVNNSVNIDVGNTSGYAFYYYNTSATQNATQFTNNNFVNSGAGYAAYIYNNLYLASADYNNYYRASAGNLLYWGGYRADLAALKTAYPLNNVNSVSMDPSYFGVSDLHTLSIPFNNLGTPLTYVTTDIDGETRSLTTPDIGADEYTPPANDLAVVEWLTPLTGMNVNAAATVSVRITNYGTASQTNPTVKYSIDGGATTVTGTYSGTILSQATDTFTFTTTANFGTFGNYNCLAYTDIATEQNRLNDTVFYDVYACTPLTGSYTIGLGTSSTFNSFGEAVQALTACGITGPVVITVDTGIFNEQVNITNIPGTSPTNTVTFIGTSGNTTIFFESTNTSERAVVTLDGVKNLTLDGLNIVSGPAATYGWGVHLWHSADSNTIQNCHIELNNPTNSSNFNAILATNSKTSYSTNGANANYLTLDNNTIKGGYYGIGLRGLNNSSGLAVGNKIINNTIYDYTYYGMYIYYQNAPEIDGNSLTGIPTAYYHMYFYYCDNDLKVTNNKIDFQYGYGMYFYYCDGTTSSRGLVANNMISQHTRNSTVYGMRVNYSANMDIVYNSINVDVGNTSGYAFYYYNTSTAQNATQFTNNNFVNSGAGYAAYIYNNAYLASADYNNYYRASAGNLLYWGGYRTNLAALQTAYPLNNINSVSMDPDYLSNTDLHTYSIPFNNLGTPLTYVTDDIDGETRSLTTPNIGADEYTPPANNLGVVDIVGNFDTWCGSADSLFVVVKNFGTATQTSVPVSFVGTSPSGAVSMSGTITSIASLQLDTVYMGILAATAPGMYIADAYATLATDTLPNNDTMSVTGEVYAPDAIGYVQTFDSLNAMHWDMDGNGSFNWKHHTSGAVYADFWNVSSGACEMISPAVNIPANDAAYLGFKYAYYNGYSYDDTLEVYAKACGDANWTLIWAKGSSDLETTGGGATSPGNYVDVSAQIPAFMQGSNVRIMFRGLTDWGPNLYIDGMTIMNAPVVAIGPDTALCIGDSITLDAGSFYSADYLWTRGLDTVATTQTYTATTAGSYVAKVTQFGVSGMDAINIVFNASAAASFTGLNATYCDDEMASMLMPTPAGGMFTGNGITSNMFDPATSGLGNHVITYTFTSPAGCISIGTDTTDVFEAVVVNLMDTDICEGDSVMLAAGSPAPAVADLIFSMYIEGSSNNKAIEVYNATMDTLNLDNYSIMTNYNGNPWSGQYRFPAGYMLSPGDVFVIGNAAADSIILSVTDDTLAYNQGGYIVGFNGDDVRALYKHNSAIDSMMIDIIGRYDLVDPGSGWDVAGVTNATKDHSLVRKSTIVGGNTDWDDLAGTDSVSSEYIVYPKNTFTYLGSHSATAPPVIPYTYLWSTGDTTASITVMPTTTTTYSVTVDNGNCQTTDSAVVTVNAIPMVNLGNDTTIKWTYGVVNLDAGNPNASSWDWSTGDTYQTVTFTNANLSYSAPNVISVLVTENGCSASDTIVITADNDVSIEGAIANMNVEVYPNPTKGQFNMTIAGYKGNVQMHIVDIAGQIVYSEKINVTANYVGKFDMTKLSSGVYYIKLTSNNAVKVQRLIIQK